MRSRLRSFCFAGACLILVGLYLPLAGRAYLAAHLAENPDLPNIERATRLEPSNAEYRALLGRNRALSGPSLDESISDYRIAVHLNPYESRYWLDLAEVYQIAGRTDEEAQSVEQAVKADPTTPHVAWEAANFFLVQGDRDKALRHFRVGWQMIRMRLTLPFSFAGVLPAMRIRSLTKRCQDVADAGQAERGQRLDPATGFGHAGTRSRRSSRPCAGREQHGQLVGGPVGDPGHQVGVQHVVDERLDIGCEHFYIR